jgi:hypothetical protein
MWEDPVPSEPEELPFPEPDEEPPPPVWTDGQLVRIENEWRKAQRAFAYHPILGISPVRGDPPYEYQLDFRMRSLVLNEMGELEYVDEVSMNVWLPPGFPNQAPVARPMVDVFHPNISADGVFLTQWWQPGDSLVDLASRIGELLAFRNYDPETVVNPAAMNWLAENHASLPLDAHADFSPFNGGEPLGRIQRLGPGTLEQIRRALDNMRFALLAEDGAPTMEEVVDFAKKTRAAVNLFLDGDVPDHLRQQASECDDWCRELPDSVPLWEHLRHQRTRAAAAEHAAGALRKSAATFAIALRELESLVRTAQPGTPAAAVKTIPSMEKLQPSQLKLPPLGREFEKWAAEARGLVEAMKEPTPEVPIAADGSMGRRLASQGEMVRETVDAATRAAKAALNEVDGLLRRAKPEIQALEQVVGYREYVDMFTKARDLEKQLAEWGSAGVQAFFLTNSSGTFGPFQFEEPVDLGATRVVVRSLQKGHIDAVNATGQELLGRDVTGSVTLILGKEDGNPGYETTFRLTERCDDLIVQLGFIQEQTIDALSQLQQPVQGAKSWCGAMSALLSDPHQQQHLRESNRKAAHRWKAIVADLVALSKFKERLATYNLVTRISEEVPRVRGLIADADKRNKESTQTIEMVMTKASKDVGTDQFMVPPKYAKAYTEALVMRDQTKHEMVRMRNLLKQIARDLAGRLASSRLVGRPEVPQFRALGAVPQAMLDLQDAMSDETLARVIGELSAQFGVKLPFNPPPAPAVTHVARPAAPTAAPAPEEAEPPVEEGAESAGEWAGSVEEEGPSPQAPAPEANPGEVSAAPATEEDLSLFVQSVEEPAAEPGIEYGEEAAPQEEMIEGFFTEDAPAVHHPHPGGPPAGK